jgi:hypothetical protein
LIEELIVNVHQTGQRYGRTHVLSPEMPKAAWQQGRKQLFCLYGKTYVQTLGEQDYEGEFT